MTPPRRKRIQLRGNRKNPGEDRRGLSRELRCQQGLNYRRRGVDMHTPSIPPRPPQKRTQISGNLTTLSGDRLSLGCVLGRRQSLNYRRLGVDALRRLFVQLPDGGRAGEVAVGGDLDRVQRRRAVDVRRARLRTMTSTIKTTTKKKKKNRTRRVKKKANVQAV